MHYIPMQDAVMIERDVERHLADFDQAIVGAAQPDECWKALQNLTCAVAGFKLFTVMTLEMSPVSFLMA